MLGKFVDWLFKGRCQECGSKLDEHGLCPVHDIEKRLYLAAPHKFDRMKH